MLHTVAPHPLEQHLVATGASDGVVNVWDLRAPGQLLSSVRAHKGDVWDVAWHDDEPQYAAPRVWVMLCRCR